MLDKAICGSFIVSHCRSSPLHLTYARTTPANITAVSPGSQYQCVMSFTDHVA